MAKLQKIMCKKIKIAFCYALKKILYLLLVISYKDYFFCYSILKIIENQ